MGVNANFVADFSTFIDAINKADLQLADFGKGAEKVEQQLNAMVDKFSGRKVIQEASELTIAIDKIGGVSKLTASELQTVGVKANEAVDKLLRMGYEVPKGLQDLADATRKNVDATDSYSQSLLKVGQQWAVGIASGEILADVIRAVAAAAWDAAKALPAIVMHGADVASVEDSFKRLAGAIGQNSDELLGRLREGTHGTISDFELMTTANKNLGAGVNYTAQQYGVMTEFALRLANAEGSDVKTALDKVNTALLTGRTNSVAALVSKDALIGAEDRFADKLHTTAEHLSDDQKLWAAREGIFDAMTAKSARLGEVTDGLSEHVQRGQAAWANFTDKLGAAIAASPVLEEGFKGIEKAIGAAFSDEQQSLIISIRKIVEGLAIGAVDVAKVMVQAGVMIQEKYADVRLTLQGVAEAYALTRDPSHIADLAGNLKQFAEQWAKTRVEAERTGAATIAALDATQTRMRDARDENARTDEQNKQTRDSQAALNTAVIGTGDAFGQYSTEVGKTKAELAAAEAATKKYNEAWENLTATSLDYRDTLAGMSNEQKGLITDYLQAGKAQSDIATALQINVELVKAVAAGLKEAAATQKEIDALAVKTSKIWDEYYTELETRGDSALTKQLAGIDLWARTQKAAWTGSLADATAYYDAIDAKAGLMKEHALVDWGTIAKASKDNLTDTATVAQHTYEEMRDHAWKYRDEAIEAQRLVAEKAEQAAQGIGDNLAAAFKKPQPEIDQTKQKVAELHGQLTMLVNDPAIPQYFGSLSSGLSSVARTIAAGGNYSPGEAAYIAGGGIIHGSIGGITNFRALGGPVERGTPYVVGERGPELFVPSAPGTVLPNGGGGVNVTVNINGSVLSTSNEIARVVGEAMMNLLRSQGTRLPVGAYST